MRGHVDFISTKYITGWACAESDTVEIEVTVNGRMIGKSRCDRFRQDLKDARISDGNSGFHFDFDRQLNPFQDHQISARIIGASEPLNGAAHLEAINLTEIRERGFRIGFPVMQVTAHVSHIDKTRYRVDGTVHTNGPRPSLLKPLSDCVVEDVTFRHADLGPPWSDFGIYQTEFTAVIESWSGTYISATVGSYDGDYATTARFAVPTVSYDDSHVPPPHSIERVVGPLRKKGYLTRGLNDAHTLCALVFNAGMKRPRGKWLDWGCGPGRVAVPLQRTLLPEWEICGVDVDAYNIEVAKNICNGVRLEAIDFNPPLPFDDRSFDVAHGLSVMTHLQERDQNLWLSELHRVLRPDGIAILTTHGELSLLDRPHDLVSSIGFDFLSRGFSAEMRDNNLGLLLPKKDYYRSTFQSEPYTRAKFGELFEIVNHIGFSQDFWVLRKRP